MKDKFSLVYIDDNPDTALSKYFDQEFGSDEYEIDYSEVRFSPDEGYKSLLSNPIIQQANIIFIDSLLFENRTANGQKFTGEEFKFILRKFYPFIEVVVITQNKVEDGVVCIPKYDRSFGDSSYEYYCKTLPKVINNAVANIRQYRVLATSVEKNDSWEEIIKEKALLTLRGIPTYDDLTISDIDRLISAFKEMEGHING